MLNVHNLTVSFMGTDLFSGITFKLNKGDRIGLIGKNGAGKSTLLKVLSKDIESSGTMAFDKDVQIGFLRQDIDFVEGRTILEEAYQAFEEIKEIEVKLDEINEQLATRTDYESEGYSQLIHDLTDSTERYELLGGYNYQGDTEKILQGLGFQREDFDKLTSTFSGGWRMRIELAKLLLQNNDILLLDEPTNHLDIESIIWLENFLKGYSGAIVLVSHDKMFLDNVTNRTIEISLGQIYDYKKPYSEFLLLRGEIKEKQLQAQKNQEKEIKQKQHLINKFKAKASKASMAQSLMKQLDKVELIEVDQDDNQAMNVRFAISKEPGKIIVDFAQNVTEAKQKITQQNPDIIFLDIEMPGQTGFDLLAQLKTLPIVVFCTAYDQYALEAFETNSIDYLVKPVKLERIEKTVQKLKSFDKSSTSEDILNVLKEITSRKEVKKMTSITVKKNEKLIFIKLDDIAFFEAENNYVNINSETGIFLSNESISTLENKLPTNFIRIHRSIIINKEYVNDIQKYFNSRFIITLNNKKQSSLTSGRSYNNVIKNWLHI